MSLTLACAGAHPAIPAIVPGDHLVLERGGVVVPRTPAVLRRLAAAVRDGCLVLGGPDPWDCVEADILVEWDRLTHRIEAKLAEAQRSRAIA